MTTCVILIIVLSLSTNMKNGNSSQATQSTRRVPGCGYTATNAAPTERSVRRTWKNCVEAEEANRMLKILVSEGRATGGVEAYSWGRAGQERWADRGESGRVQVMKEEMLSRIDNSNAKVRSLKKLRRDKSNGFRSSLSQNVFKRTMKKILEFAKNTRDIARQEQDQKVRWVRKKYGRPVDDFKVPDEAKEYSNCKMFQENPEVKCDEVSGPVVVCREGEKLELDNKEWRLLARGPKYCTVRSCREEDMRVEVETSILKHKWDEMGREGDEEEGELTPEEVLENERVALLAEEMGAQQRMVYNSKENTWDARGLRVTDYKHNSRVIFPKALPGDKESNLEVLRSELLHHHKEWVTQNCNCKGEQQANLSQDEQEGLKSIRKRVADGDIVILPTDKSGRFAVMSMDTYVEAGRVHIKDDIEVGNEEKKSNQKVVNGAVSMLLKVFRVGNDCKHEGRWRESMLSSSLESCPLWLLFKDHKNWTSSKGGAPPTRPVMGGNSGMNSHLSEILSWLLEPLANSMMEKSSEVISDEDLKHKIDKLNLANRDWKPETKIEHPIGESSVMGEQLELAPGLCGCEDCVDQEEVPSSEDISQESSSQCKGESSSNNKKSDGEGGGCVHAQTGSMSNNVTKSAEGEQMGGREYIFSSMRKRGNRNKALLLKERREQLKERRSSGYRRCGMVNSKQVAQEWIQDRGQAMVIIGSDAVSLFPSLTKQESADEVAEAVMDSELKWDGVNWKEAVRYLALGRDETWCRSSKLRRVLPWRKSNKGTRPGLTGVGPLGAESDDEKQWKFPGVELTAIEKKMIMSEVLRLSIELMFSTHIYSFGGKSYKQREGGPMG